MDAILKFLSTLTSWLPRIALIRETEIAVLWWRGKPYKLKPGIRVWLPLLMDLQREPCIEVVTDLYEKWATTADGQSVSFDGIVVTVIDDSIKYALTVVDRIGIIQAHALPVFSLAIQKRNLTQIICSLADSSINDELTEQLQDRLTKYGMCVSTANVTGFSSVVALHHIGLPWGGGNSTTTQVV